MPMQNGFVESFIGRLRDECLHEYLFNSYNQAREIIQNWGIDYNQNCRYMSLKRLTPDEFINLEKPDRNENRANLKTRTITRAG